jgi:cytochrome c peroxidase
LLLLVFGLVSCGAKRESSTPIGPPVQIEVPLGLPKVEVPADNPPTAATIALGRRLYYDTKLSADGTLACAGCHNPRFGFADGRRVSRGAGDQLGTRSAPTVLNAAYYPLQFWDGRAKSLEDQAAGPIANPIEMNQSHDACVDKLNGDAEYVTAFEAAFGPGRVSIMRVQKAIASFERTLLSGNSAFDRYQYGGDRNALSPSAVRGLEVFKDAKRGNCAVCHSIGERDALFTDGKFHNIGSGIDPNGELIDLGRYHQTKVEADKGAFKTPTLRNIALTAPYMHDGSKKTLKDVVDFYVGGGTSNPHLDKEIKELKLSGQERADLVTFMESLTGEMPPNSGPPESK